MPPSALVFGRTMKSPLGNFPADCQAQFGLAESIGAEEALSAKSVQTPPTLYVNKQTQDNDGGSDRFITAYLIVVQSLTETLFGEVSRARGVAVDRGDEDQRKEVCAAMWATIRSALAASMLSARQQQFVINALSARLDSHWQSNLCSKDGVDGPITERAAFYLQHVDPPDPVTTAVRIVEILFEATNVPQAKRPAKTRLLAGLIAHRIFSDVWLFNDWESQGKVGSITAGRD